MALTLTNASAHGRSDDVWGRLKVRIVKVTFDSSYDTGGESLTPAMLGLASIDHVSVEPDAAALPGHVVAYDYTNKKLLVFVEEAVAAGGPLLEIAAASNLSTLVVRLLVIGT